ncbi:MAG TPA: hypothetical protein VHM70_21070 [Polyangiaceae bacterium]|jgi:predicted metal-dependent HD superfamily phosphohydrolase|nr:hypothetical protein [Polyangiaceae bacterium]
MKQQSDLVPRWQTTWQRVGALPAPGLLDRVRAAYSEPQRHYHTLQHLRECFTLYDSVVGASPNAAVELALWFHDAIYDPTRQDNEARSADWARSALEESGAPEALQSRVRELVLATKHGPSAPGTPDAQLLLDVDLSILGAEPERFAEYELQIRREYAWVPEASYRAARAHVLRQFQDRAVLYHTPAIHTLLEARARDNLTRALAAFDS